MFVVLCLLLGLRSTALKTEAKPHVLFICHYSSLPPSLCNNSEENIKVILIIAESQKRAYIIVDLFTNVFLVWGDMYVNVCL